MSRIILDCPNCGRTHEVDRGWWEPPEIARVVQSCSRCDPDESGDPEFYDADGYRLEPREIEHRPQT